jgi:hypothetical protein
MYEAVADRLLSLDGQKHCQRVGNVDGVGGG